VTLSARGASVNELTLHIPVLPDVRTPPVQLLPQRALVQKAPPVLQAEAWREQPGSDVVATGYPLALSDLVELVPGSTLTLPHPEGGWMTLEVDAREDVDDMTRLRLYGDGLVSTVTLANSAFLATIATPSGVYGVASTTNESVIVDQRVLELRANPRSPDFRVPPTHRHAGGH
jgi:hypothetical protein